MGHGGRSYLGLRGTKLNIAVGVIAGLDFLGVMGGLLTLDSFISQFPDLDTSSDAYRAMSSSQQMHRSNIQGAAVSAYNVGCFVGSILCIFIGDRLGRRKTIFLGSSIMVIGATLQCTAFSLAHFIVGRIITGIGNGLNTSTVPTWQSECSKAHRRGQLVMVEGSLITGGICLSYWLDFGFSFLDPNSVSWRFPIAFQVVIALIILAFVMLLPESPRWLIFKGREDEATEVLSALLDTNREDTIVENEFAAIKDTVLEAQNTSWRDLFTMDENRHFHRVVLAYVNQMFQQISGINLITYYAATIYQNSIGLSGFLSRILAACNGTEYFIASWLPIFIIEKAGRRPLMLIGAAGMSLSMVVLAISTSFEGQTKPGIVAAVFLFVFNTFFAWGWLGMTWLYPAEIVPLRIRAPANALSTSANWAFNFMVVMITPVAFQTIKYQTYIIFAVINAFIFPVVYFFYPETAYRSLEEMDAIFHKTKSIWSVVRIAREEPRRYGKNGELLINYTQTDEHFHHVVVGGDADGEKRTVSNKDHANPQYHIENGDAVRISESS
ncbi:MFS monosaccharide transporter, putative [Talaromyces stipitatus ATCC 10500]|uniref:MFS monosaccharide transporter, putative n=1 Tax=Talaromyces stipitatus (strain ATCC 10500 / CBS 375.48 / QM 6759 / NRRL 1006) TaxID=441959 RepID=B8M9G1_TALSN|nr:MFS monosaccharide transporter, putative [Talaromyces stipitatus ATCC 10500]EED17721.1 MFS monosaccharide transporter, putative [Talaromyces stipitatus ATCC 10500]